MSKKDSDAAKRIRQEKPKMFIWAAWEAPFDCQ